MTAPRPPLLPRLAARLYRALLALYPAAFRAAYGREMVELFRRGSQDRRARGAGALAPTGAVTAEAR